LLEYVRTMRLEQRRQEIQNGKDSAERDLRWAQQLAAHSESKEEDGDAENQRGSVVDDD
jgi:F0F1-type ATP synthase membrane subunit b/b'